MVIWCKNAGKNMSSYLTGTSQILFITDTGRKVHRLVRRTIGSQFDLAHPLRTAGVAPTGVAADTGKRSTAVWPDVVVRALAHATTGQKDAGAAVLTDLLPGAAGVPVFAVLAGQLWRAAEKNVILKPKMMNLIDS